MPSCSSCLSGTQQSLSEGNINEFVENATRNNQIAFLPGYTSCEEVKVYVKLLIMIGL